MSNTIGKQDLARRIADVTGVSGKAAAAAIDALTAEITAATQDGKTVTIPGFGRFKLKTRAARQGRNPRTGEAVEVPESRALTFKAAKPKP